jgi:hypothetical protein
VDDEINLEDEVEVYDEVDEVRSNDDGCYGMK